jgi:uncharacterized protein (TIGR02246 family)
MRTWKALGEVVLSLAMLLVAVHADDKPSKPSSKGPSLTPLDYIEIRQLVARYAYAVDTGANDGHMYADLFAPDGAFVGRNGEAISGREELAALGRVFHRGPQATFHFIMNHVIEPSPAGVTGKEYLLQLRIGENGRPNDIFGGGRYEDAYVKTPHGWRFKRRQFIPAEPAVSSAQSGFSR